MREYKLKPMRWTVKRLFATTIVAGLALNLVIVSGLVLAVDEQPLPELEIHNKFRPVHCKRVAKATDLLTLHYKGTMQDGKVFDSSYDRGEPITFQIGIGHVILGWEKGLIGVCVGESLRLVVPPHLGYGDAKHDQIPPGSTLTFDIEIIKVEDGPKPLNVFKEIDTDNDERLSRKEMGEFLMKQLHQARPGGDLGTLDDPDQMQMVDEIFTHEDKDKDDYITREEFSGPKTDHDEL